MIQVFGWTLLHSLWQIALITMGYWVVKQPLKEKAATIKYYLAISAMTLCLVISLVTFIYFQEAAKNSDVINPILQEINADTPKLIIPEVQEKIPLSQLGYYYYLPLIFPYLVAIWSIGVLFLTTKLLLGFRAIKKLQTTDNKPFNKKWLQKINVCKMQLGFEKQVAFFWSKQLQEPITFGHFKPIVLLPISMMTGLSPTAIETIILHELAHIKRNDFLVNLGQSIIEILFFYHPLIWWLSKEVRESREECCDELVLKVGVDRTTYVKTLTALKWELVDSKKPSLALSLTGVNSGFTKRIKRMFGVVERDFSPQRFLSILGLAIVVLSGLYKIYVQKINTSTINIELQKELAVMKAANQKQRVLLSDLSQKYPPPSPLLDSIWAIQEHLDSLNTVRIEEIIAQYGYPGKSLVGKKEASTGFLIIQAAELATQEKYIPLLVKAATEGEVKWSSIALLIDRVRLQKGQTQIYGSQVMIDNQSEKGYFPLIDQPYKIDSVRASIGLSSLQEYADHWNMTWDPEKHIQFHKERSLK